MTAHAMRVLVAVSPILCAPKHETRKQVVARAQRENPLPTTLTLIDSRVVCLCDFALRRTG